MTVVPPVLVTVSDRDFVFPTVTVPKLMLLGFAPKPPGETPVPDKGMVRVVFEALDVIVTLPVALPAEDGLKTTLKFALCPDAKVRGAVIPLRVNPLLTAIWEIVTLEPPVLVTVSDSEEFLPTITLPKSRLVGLDDRVPAETPVPDNGRVSVESEASETIVTAPVVAPAAWGANATVKFVLWEGFSVSGAVIPLIWNPVPLTETCEMLTLDSPEFVRVTVCVCCAPTVTLPNASLVGLRASSPGSAPAPVPAPARLNVAVAFDASLAMVVVALKGATALGANDMLIDVL